MLILQKKMKYLLYVVSKNYIGFYYGVYDKATRGL